MNVNIKTLVKLVLISLFLICLLDMPYGYFQLVRFLGMTGFAWLAYQDKDKADKTLLIVWIASALLINPFIKVPLGRTIWNIVDVIWAAILLATIRGDRMNGKEPSEITH